MEKQEKSHWMIKIFLKKARKVKNYQELILLNDKTQQFLIKME
jgi:hypothetical protein